MWAGGSAVSYPGPPGVDLLRRRCLPCRESGRTRELRPGRMLIPGASPTLTPHLFREVREAPYYNMRNPSIRRHACTSTAQFSKSDPVMSTRPDASHHRRGEVWVDRQPQGRSSDQVRVPAVVLRRLAADLARREMVGKFTGPAEASPHPRPVNRIALGDDHSVSVATSHPIPSRSRGLISPGSPSRAPGPGRAPP